MPCASGRRGMEYQPARSLRGTVVRLAMLACYSAMSISIEAQSWMQTSAPITNWTALASSADGTKLFAAANGPGGIFASSNSGLTWTQTSAPVLNWAALATSSDGERLFATEEESTTVWNSTNSGVTWTPHFALPYGGARAVAASSDGAKVVVTGVYYIYTSWDLGLTWMTTSPSNSLYPATGVASSADGTTLGAVSQGHGNVFEFYSSTNSGSSWTEIDGPPNSNSYGTLASSADGMRLVTALAWVGIYTSTNLGQTWEQSDATGNTSWHSVASSADGTKMLAASAFLGNLYTSSDSGASWVQTSAPQTNWSVVASSAVGDKLIAAVKGGGIYTWQAAPPLRLNIRVTHGSVILSWDALSSSILEQNNDLATANWAPVTAPTLQTNGQNEVTLPLTAGGSFYRLKTL